MPYPGGVLQEFHTVVSGGERFAGQSPATDLVSCGLERAIRSEALHADQVRAGALWFQKNGPLAVRL